LRERHLIHHQSRKPKRQEPQAAKLLVQLQRLGPECVAQGRPQEPMQQKPGEIRNRNKNRNIIIEKRNNSHRHKPQQDSDFAKQVISQETL
jgi:hypothetical protein